SGQEAVPACRTRPDFLYEGEVAVYIDGPIHDYPERARRDADQTEAMEDRGFTVLRFDDEATWGEIIVRYPNVFGAARPTIGSERATPDEDAVAAGGLDADLFAPEWLPLLEALATEPGVSVEPGEDVVDTARPDRPVVGQSAAVVRRGQVRLHLLAAQADAPADDPVLAALGVAIPDGGPAVR